MNELKAISKIVEQILNDVPATRDDDRLLYLTVVKWMKPSAEYQPFTLTIMDKTLPSPETVRRSRQKVQELNRYLRPSADVSGMRLEKEHEFFDFAIGKGSI